MDVGQSQSMDPFLEEIEKKLLEHITGNMEKGKITIEQSQQLAKEFLALLPVADKEDLLKKLSVLGRTYPEAQAVYLDYALPYEEQQRQQKLTKMSELIKQGNIEQAISTAKGGQ